MARLPWHRLLLPAAILAVVLPAVAVVAAFPDAVARSRRLTQRHAEAPAGCDLAEGPCTARFADGPTLTLRLDPTGASAGAQRAFLLEHTEGVEPLSVEVQGIDMHMGYVRVPLSRTTPGRAQGSTLLPACTQQTMTWRADAIVRVDQPEGPETRVAGFRFQTKGIQTKAGWGP